MKKVIVINGIARSGKDTFVEMAQEYVDVPVHNFSSIDPIKEELKRNHGWDGVDKSDAWREKMVQMKRKMTAEGDKPTMYLLEKVQSVLNGVIFLHIREPEEIDKLKSYIPNAQTLLVTRDVGHVPDNDSDRRVEEYVYDTVIENNGELEELLEEVLKFFGEVVPLILEAEVLEVEVAREGVLEG